MKNKTMEYKDKILHLIDQRKLPETLEIFKAKNYREVEMAISDMIVRGAPAIGAAAAYGVVMAAEEFIEFDDFFKKMDKALKELNESRPTAVNLMWAIDEMKKVIEENKDKNHIEILQALNKRADEIYQEDIETNKKIGQYGNEIIPENARILTHCNAGALATVDYGTALGVIRAAHEANKNISVWVDETRPRLQGANLTAWEMVEENIPATLISDNVGASLMRKGEVDVIVVGADRIALNGDTANKIGTLMLAVLAKEFDVPFYIAAPITTIDFDIENGDEIEIEERSSEEVTHIKDVKIAPEGIDVYNPAFDVTPWKYIDGIITDKGIIRKPYRENILNLKE